MAFIGRIVWCDPNIHNRENQKYLKALQVSFTVEPFSERNKALQFLQDTKQRFVVMTNGVDGEAFVKQIHNLKSVSAIVVFCMPRYVPLHKQWASPAQYPKVSDVVGVFSAVENTTHQLFRKLQASSLASVVGINAGQELIVNIADIETPRACADQRVQYNSKCASLASGFKLVLARLLTMKLDEARILAEMTKLCRGSEANAKKMISAWKSWGNKPLSQKVVKMYTENYIYRGFNEACAKSDFMSVINTLAGLYVAANQSSLSTSVSVLYRGIRSTGKCDFKVGESFWLPAATSTSKSISVAKSAFGDDVIYEIHLLADKTKRHPNIDLSENPDWGTRGGEMEVLLLPFSHFLVKRVEQQGKSKYVTLEELPSVYRQPPSKSEIRTEIDKLTSDIIEKAKRNIKTIQSRMDELLDLRSYFLGLLPGDRMPVERTLSKWSEFDVAYDTKPNAIFEDLVPLVGQVMVKTDNILQNRLDFGSGMRKFAELLQSECKEELPIQISKRMKGCLQIAADEFVSSFVAMIECDKGLSSFVPQMNLDIVFSQLLKGLLMEKVVESYDPSKVRGVMERFGIFGLLVYLLMGGPAIQRASEALSSVWYDEQTKTKMVSKKTFQSVYDGCLRTECQEMFTKFNEENRKETSRLLNAMLDSCVVAFRSQLSATYDVSL
eukprot:c7692_g1_i1.p1 GENE.c7692_g1_i1~~c7692_g1_i1.p1  ORF type:complete len:682 (-),score=140.32 c7692_g1_i1:239-2239(-)